ncbi:hypothetical protein ABI59_19195 [Acidobacteria bacterium Mor1]|nr:hypothetical protein ABI59_19195 [Acidobacteria bacterium Mor1]
MFPKKTMMILLLTLPVLFHGCSGGGDGVTTPSIIDLDGDWSGNFTHPRVQTEGGIGMSLAENQNGTIAGTYTMGFRLIGSGRSGRDAGSVSGQRNGNQILLRIEDTLIDDCDWVGNLTQTGDLLTGTYDSSCNSNSGDLTVQLQ